LQQAYPLWSGIGVLWAVLLIHDMHIVLRKYEYVKSSQYIIQSINPKCPAGCGEEA